MILLELTDGELTVISDAFEVIRTDDEAIRVRNPPLFNAMDRLAPLVQQALAESELANKPLLLDYGDEWAIFTALAALSKFHQDNGTVADHLALRELAIRIVSIANDQEVPTPEQLND